MTDDPYTELEDTKLELRQLKGKVARKRKEKEDRIEAWAAVIVFIGLPCLVLYPIWWPLSEIIGPEGAAFLAFIVQMVALFTLKEPLADLLKKLLMENEE